MREWLADVLGQGGFLPHGYCFTWSPGVLWSMVGADAVIAASYYSIPLVLVQVARKRPDVQFNWVLLLFSAFIFACGTTHVMAIWVIWQPDYAVEALAKTFTAAVSIVAAVALWPLLPRVLAIPSTAQLRSAVERLEAEARQRRSAEESLADVEQTLAATLASIGAGFIATDRTGRVVRINSVAERVTGWTQADALGQPYWNVFERENRPDTHLEKSPIDVDLALGAQPELAHHFVCIARDGRRTSVEVRASTLQAPDGTVRGLAVVMRDLTDERRAQAESNQLAAIVASSHDAIIGTTLDGRISSWNAAAQAMFGYRADEIVGRPVQELQPPERAGEEDRLLEALARGEVVPPFDTVRLARHGTPLDVSITASPVRDSRGAIVGASKIMRDISGKRRAEEARMRALSLQAENRQIQAASRLKSEFLANMSHELRTPLNAIIGFADLMHSGRVAPDSPKHRVFVDHIRASGRHLLQLINDILDLSKIEAGKLEFEPEPVALPALAADVVNLLNEQAVAKMLTIRVQVDPAVAQLVIDPRRLKQVLYNYLSNALKFTPEGGCVTVRALPEDTAGQGGTPRWRLEVEDTGIGIRPEDIGRLFTEFHQLDGSLAKRHAGTGLGLALTRRLVEAQGGTVGARSVFGEGSVFHAVLPRVAAVAAGAEAASAADSTDLAQTTEVTWRGPAASPAAAAAGPPAGAPGAGHAARPAPSRGAPAASPAVLVVEDSRLDGGALTEALSGAGFAVAWATSAAAALQLSRERRFAAITLDLLLPDRPGLELLADIREAGPNRETPVLVVTVRGHPLPLEAYAVADVLSKPVRGPAVLAALAHIGVAAPRGREAGARQAVMVVDDEGPARALIGSALESAGYEVALFEGAAAALQALPTLRPAAAIVDLSMPGLDGFAMLERLREMPEARTLPVLVWTSRDLDADDRRHLHARADAVLSKGANSIAQVLEHVRMQLHTSLEASATPLEAQRATHGGSDGVNGASDGSIGEGRGASARVSSGARDGSPPGGERGDGA
ncbi:MAG: PAS domain S-box protein [Burkholderiales bacterium]|nr:PAS domain S-box protein [Burkholderiales bacterium]